MALTAAVSTVDGKSFEIPCTEEDTVKHIREVLETKHIEVPPACYLKLFHGPQVVHDAVPIKDLDLTQTIFAVLGRETNVEILLQAAGSYQGYKDLVKAASSEGGDVKAIKMPSILSVLEDMGGQKPEVKHMKQGEHGLEMNSADGWLLLPSLNLGVLQKEGKGFSEVVFSVQLNSDAYNQGLGIVLEQPSSMQSDVDEKGLPRFIYNGFGLSKDKNSNAIKFHPGMGGGQLRVEGVGGFGNTDIGVSSARVVWQMLSCSLPRYG
ncbi:unnamed protein product [Symbiodinium pilosum]|uniref:Ubiquitin-like domain-containing protein n=1 Tax=Symbiodinium pilosum TaxID=2952 RepID=A0A812XDB3_SYMPI|nr:unnamed protein product [Symbiodinium pilosum]